MKKSKSEQIYIFFIVLLSLLLTGSIILILIGWPYHDEKSSDTSFEIGGQTTISLAGSHSASMAYAFDGDYLAGEELPHNISVKNAGEKNLFLRAKISVFTGDSKDPKIDIVTNGNWSQTGEYYYYNSEIESLATVALLRGFVINKSNELSSKESYILVVTVEGLSTEFDKNIVWGA